MTQYCLRTLGALDLVGSEGRSVREVLRQPKRLAVLAYLVTRRPSGWVGRDELLGLFWPDLEETRARNALNKSLHFLRKVLHEAAVVSLGRSRISATPDVVRCDAVELRAALEEGDAGGALRFYLGEFLPGIELSGAPVFMEWLEGERRWYREAVRESAHRVLALALSRGRIPMALQTVAFLERIAPTEVDTVRAAVRTLLQAGDRPAALQRLEEYERWLREEYGEGVPAELVRLLGGPPAPSGRGARSQAPADPSPELLEASRRAIRVQTLEEYREFVDLLPDMAYRCDLRGSFPFVNETAVRTMGWEREEFRDLSFDDLVRDDYRDQVVEFYLRQVAERVPLTYLEFPAVTRDGREVWVGQRVRLLDRNGEAVGVQVVTRDITSRIRREAGNRRAALEDRETRLLNREAFHLLGEQRIRENRRSGETFFVLHIRLTWMHGGEPSRSDADRAVRVVASALREELRASDALARPEELALVVLSARGGVKDGRTLEARIRAILQTALVREELQDFRTHYEVVVHDPVRVAGADVLMPVARVVEG